MSFKPFLLKAAVISIHESGVLTETDAVKLPLIPVNIQNLLDSRGIPTLIMGQTVSDAVERLETAPCHILFIG
ncbi:MAG TPA: hypothetical protein VLP30_05865, partial [Desulfatirhabdiaceae bacterium]|nr:hypothetical protein [Desulfatirhabdiaceae bacterium]